MDQYIDEITDAECDGLHDCGMCSLYGQCRDRRPIEKCAICDRHFTDEEMHFGVCIECLTEAVEPQTLREYVRYSAAHCEGVWESLFEAYFSEPDDKANINKASNKLRTALFECILRDWASDRITGDNECKDKLTAWVGEDDTAWDDFAAWLLKKKGEI